MSLVATLLDKLEQPFVPGVERWQCFEPEVCELSVQLSRRHEAVSSVFSCFKHSLVNSVALYFGVSHFLSIKCSSNVGLV